MPTLEGFWGINVGILAVPWSVWDIKEAFHSLSMAVGGKGVHHSPSPRHDLSGTIRPPWTVVAPALFWPFLGSPMVVPGSGRAWGPEKWTAFEGPDSAKVSGSSLVGCGRVLRVG